jgi:hypothetical protein
MIDLGDVQLGQQLPVTVQCLDGDLAPAWPDQAPQLVLFSGTTLLNRIKLPADPRSGVGMFRLSLFLNAIYPTAGPVTGFVQWVSGGVAFSKTVWFRILPGGDPDGNIIAMTFVRRPGLGAIVWQADSGTIFHGSNPRVTK